jgi:4-amino-4-deoxy-L-arabinose transferase-like glycosyltransferase
MTRKLITYQLIILLIASGLYISFNGRVHLFDWDEINFAESAREMIQSGDYLTVQINYQPFWEKPPLFIWFQVVSMKMFGINEFAARFPNAICGILTLLLLFHLGRKLDNLKFGWIWVMTFACSTLPFFYFKSGIIDPWFNLFIFSGVYLWVKAFNAGQFKDELLFVVLSASSLGLAVMTKGPVAVLVFGVVVGILFLINGFRVGINWKNIIVFFFTLLFVGGFWFLLQIFSGNVQMVVDFFVYQVRLFRTEDAGHGGFPFYHFIVLLIGVFPASIFAIQGHRYIGKSEEKKVFHTAMIVLFWVVLILFSIVKTKIIHYSSLCYFPMTYLAAYSISKITDGSFKFQKAQKILLAIIGLFFSIFALLLPVFRNYKDFFLQKIPKPDAFTAGNMQADPGWSYWLIIIGLILLGSLVFGLLFSAKNKLTSIATIFISNLVFVYLIILFVTPGAEKISQNAEIEFIKSVSNEDAYIYSFHKSYAPPFYGNLKPGFNPNSLDQDWLLSGNIDKDVYFIVKSTIIEEIKVDYPDLQFINERNGYVFLKRTAIR